MSMVYVIPLVSQNLRSHDTSKAYLSTKTSQNEVYNVHSAVYSPVVDFVDEVEPNDSPGAAQQLFGPFPVGVNGTATVDDVGSIVVSDDDVEDLYEVTLPSGYVKLNLYDFSADLDLFLFKIEGNTITI